MSSWMVLEVSGFCCSKIIGDRTLLFLLMCRKLNSHTPVVWLVLNGLVCTEQVSLLQFDGEGSQDGPQGTDDMAQCNKDTIFQSDFAGYMCEVSIYS